jgi:hypothetical protein
MKNLSVFIIAVFIFSSCSKITGEGPVVTETRNVANFTGIDLRCSADVYYRQDAAYKVEVNAQQNILDVLIIEISNGKLVVRYKNDVFVKSDHKTTVIVSAPEANSFRISGSGDIKTTGPLTPSNLNLDISGSGNILLTELTTDFIDANISGSGNIGAPGGTTTEEKLNISSSGNIDLSNVSAIKVSTTTSGSGGTKVNASETLDVTISGSGSVYYKGNPVVNVNISGSGKVMRM